MFGLFGPVGIWELLIVLAIVLIIVGPKKLPQLAESIGKSIKNFRKAKDDTIEELQSKDPKRDD